MTDEQLVYWNSKEGKRRLFESEYARDFFDLAHLFERQIKPTYCGVASAVMILNAFRIAKGLTLETSLDVPLEGEERMAFNCYSQLTFFDEEIEQIESIKPRAVVEGRNKEYFNPGFSILELARKLRCFLLNVDIVQAQQDDDKSLQRFRYDLMAYAADTQTFMIANYDNKVIGHKGAGHFSPVVAYHPQTDSCLIMDTASHKNPWFWVRLSLVYKAMHTQASCGNYRGYLVVTDKLYK